MPDQGVFKVSTKQKIHTKGFRELHVCDLLVSTDVCLNVNIQDVNKGFYKNARFVKHQGHTEWARQGKFALINNLSTIKY